MNEQNGRANGLELTAQVLIRCFLGGLILLMIWFGFLLFAADWLYAMNVRWFSITREQFILVNYCGMAAVKLFVYVVFLIPYICVRLVLRKNR
jgi:hypothetical protein